MKKYKKGDFVHVIKHLGNMMKYFESDCDAIITDIGCNDKYGIYIKNKGEVAWYHEHQLELIEKNRLDLLKKWIKDKEEDDKKKSDLVWIFKNGKDVLKKTTQPSILALAKCLGMSDLWGNQGEGIIFYKNAMFVLSLAKPFLKKNDKKGWDAFCMEHKV